ncbi:MAG: hypothetical protein WD749_09380 [Phycisphaerales bacterium]
MIAPPFIGRVFGAAGDQRVGILNPNSGQSPWRATLWTPTGVVDLHPAAAALGSFAYAVAGLQQVGDAALAPSVTHAALWHQSAASFVDLNPIGVEDSFARATDGVRQGGWTQASGGVVRAALWSGSAASHISLHPSVGTTSAIHGMAPGEQVGYVNYSGIGNHAALWRGSAASYVDLNPPGAAISVLNGTCGVAQVGYANLGGVNGAGVWFGTAESFLSLHQFLPAGYFSSVATSVAVENGTLYVGGYASTGFQQEAFLWTGPIPAPGTLGVLLGAGLLACRRRR